MKINLDKYLEALDHNMTPINLQREAIEMLAIHGRHLAGELILGRDMACWSNSVLVLERIGYPGNKDAIPGLLVMLKDLNWSGSAKAFDLLAEMPSADLLPHLGSALAEADAEKDLIWIAAIRELLKKIGLNSDNLKDKHFWDIVQKGEW